RMRRDRLGDGVIRRAGPRGDLEPLAQPVPGDPRRGAVRVRARVHGEPRRSRREQGRIVVEFLLLRQVVEGPGAGGLARRRLAEARARLVGDQTVEPGDPEVALDVADAGFGAGAELHALERAAA